MQWALAVAVALVLAARIASAQDEAEDVEPAEGEAAEGEAAQEEPADEEGAPEEAGAESEELVPEEPAAEEEAPEEPLVEPYVPGIDAPAEDAVPYDDQLPPADEEVDDGKPFAKGDIELGVGIVAGGGGYFGSSTFVLGAGGSFAYYVVNRLAPGIQLQYVHVFSDVKYPDDLRVLPFLKFVILRSFKFAPYLVVAGGRDFEWGGTEDPTKGFPAVSSWLLGGGAGAHIGLGERASMNIMLLALYHWFDEKVALAGKEGLHDGALEFPILSLSIAFFF